MPLDRGDHRLFEQHPRRSHRAGAVGIVAVSADRAEVEAGAEMTSAAGQDGDLRIVVHRKGGEGVAQRVGGRGIDRVALRRALDRDDRDGAVLCDFDAHHACSFIGIGWRGAGGLASGGRAS